MQDWSRTCIWRFSLILILLTASLPSLGAAVFTDDFESGNLTNWQIDGRQQGTNTANVVTRGGSKVAHLYHAGFTEITLYRDFAYSPDLHYSLDFEASVYSDPPPASNYYGVAEVIFSFYDASYNRLGDVVYGAATTDYLANRAASSPTESFNPVSEHTVHHLSLSTSDLLSQITVDSSSISTVRMYLNTYSSTWPYPGVSAELWVDNVNVGAVPEPSAMASLLSGVAALGGIVLRRRR